MVDLIFLLVRMGGVAVEKLCSLKNKAIAMIPIGAEDKAELKRMEFGFIMMHCIAATAASRW